MEKNLRPGRFLAAAILIGAILFFYVAAMYELQISDQETYTAVSSGNYTVITTLSAARGNILDRNANLLISSRGSYNIVLSRDEIIGSEDPNGMILTLINMARASGIEYTDTFPITGSAPYSWVADMTSTQRGRLNAYFEFFSALHDAEGNPKEMEASDFIVWLKDHYKIDYTTPITEARAIIGIRYELELRAIANISSYVFAEDVGTDFVTAVLERDFPGVTITVTTTREYHTTNAAHLLGYTGKMTADEYYDLYKAAGYPYDAVVGKTGVELAFEQYLHGTDGRQVTTYNAAGKIINQTVTKEPKAGSNVMLSVDIGLQAATETALSNQISALNARRSMGLKDDGTELEPGQENLEPAQGGAVVVMDVKTNQVLAMASYPTFNPATLFENYQYLSTDAMRPMFNRATQGIYNPGSTFKMCTAYAGLSSGILKPEDTKYCAGRYTKYIEAGYAPYCWAAGGHRESFNVVGALENSCNYFFYELSDQMGIMRIATAAEQLGLGVKAGIEIPEAEGIIATPAYKENAIHETWYAADNLLAAIGQGYNFFTPVQLCNYVSTIANSGVKKRVTLLNQVMSPDYTRVLYEAQPEVTDILSNEYGYFNLLQEGMYMVGARGTAHKNLLELRYNGPTIACKTGTIQSGKAVNNGCFVCYAPYDSPQIAVAVLVEKGGSGAGIMSIALDVLDYYFHSSTASTSVRSENLPMQ